MAKSMKLKSLLDKHKGVDYKKQKQQKLQKEAEKRKKQRRTSEVDVDALEDAIAGAEEVEDAKKALKPKKEKKAAEDAVISLKLNGEGDGWETDDSEDDEEDEEDEEDGIEVGPMSDESESESEDDLQNGNADEDEEEDEAEEDIPLSDIESLASEDRADVIPHQRLTINNTAALQRSLKSFALPSSLSFSEVQAVTSAEPVEIKDVEDDLNRELAFHRQALDAVSEARTKLKAEGVPFSRPVDYFAEMVKSEEQMGKVRAKMLDEAARKKASSDARRQRDLKKFGKAVQVAKLQERQKEKSRTLDNIKTLKRKRQGGNDLTTNEDADFDVAIEDAAVTEKKDRESRRAKGGDGPNRKRQKKDQKFGFGGKKRFAKSNDAKSTGDGSSYSVKKMKGGSKRPGKSKRAKMS